MTNPHPSTIQQGFREFEEKFRHAFNIGVVADDITRKNIKSHFLSLFLTLAKERIESLRGSIKEEIGEFADYDPITRMAKNMEIEGFNNALSEEIRYWEDFIKELEKLQ